MYTISRIPTTDMEVTSIRLERDLKDRLKDLAGDQGYQALIRDVLWQYVRQHSQTESPRISREDVRFTIPATAQREERCGLTGHLIQPQEEMMLGWTLQGEMVPLSLNSL